jgi:hypothetical protein
MIVDKRSGAIQYCLPERGMELKGVGINEGI